MAPQCLSLLTTTFFMVKFYLKVKADLSNVTDLEPLDEPTTPYEYTFKILCTNCREQHGKPVNINRFEEHEITGSRGDASFVFRCKNCKSEHSAQITRTADKLKIEDTGAWAKILEIDARGIEFDEFLAEGRWKCKGAETTSQFDEVDLEDAEWYDYDEKANGEVSVTNVEFDIARS